jgi:hypothetical protein
MVGTAGGSAWAKAEQLRERAARAQQAAERWERGATGEQRTAALLEPLEAAGFVVFHDLSLPGSRANLDHVVVGPTGVWLIDSKAYRGTLWISGDVLGHNRHPLRRELDTIDFLAGAVQSVVDEVGVAVIVRAVMCVHDAEVLEDTEGVLLPIELCGADDLVALVARHADDVLAPQEVGRLATALPNALPPRSVAPAAAPAATARPARRASPPTARPARANTTPRPPSTPPYVFTLLRLLLVVGAGLALMAAGPALASRFADGAVPSTPSTTVAPPAGSPAAGP